MDTKKILIFAIIGFLVSLLIFGGTLYFLVFKGSSENKENKEVKTYTYDAGEFTTNIGGANHFFKGNVTIETTDEKEVKTITEKSAIVRDCILRVLIAQNPEDMTNDAGMEKIKKELMSQISKALESETISNIYFTNYIVQ